MAPSLKYRVEILEARVDKLQGELTSSRSGKEKKDWRRTIGAFTDDQDMQAILHEALRLREMDREKVAPMRRGKRKTKQ
jgi:hypothetical protein